MAERDQTPATEAVPIGIWYISTKHKHKPPIALPEPTYAVLCVTGYFKDKNREQKIFYSPEAVALESKGMLFPSKHGAIAAETE